jgi:putative oxygen-independent coproporphyrinogen III oxidase
MAGIYIHIPFCKKLCNYCDFYHVVSSDDHSSFLEALLKEADMRWNYAGNELISTIYFGGGTPSVLSVNELETVLNRLKKQFLVKEDSEITVELNPDDIYTGYLKDLKKAGFNRISLGVQSWRDEDLKMLNRRHTAEQASKALNDILRTGFENVSIDLIYGIPGMSLKAWESNLEQSLAFDIKHLSAYHLTIEQGTAFGKMKERGLFEEVDEEISNNEFNILVKKTESEGFIHYEISNFGKPGYFSIHNTNYWKQVPYIGLGPSAHSFNGYSRQWNISDLKKYIRYVNDGTIFYEKEELDLKTRFNEYIMTSLRTMWGIDLEYLEKTFDKESYDYVINLSGKFIDYGLMKHDKKNLILTNQGKMISDNIISEFMVPGDR